MGPALRISVTWVVTTALIVLGVNAAVERVASDVSVARPAPMTPGEVGEQLREQQDGTSTTTRTLPEPAGSRSLPSTSEPTTSPSTGPTSGSPTRTPPIETPRPGVTGPGTPGGPTATSPPKEPSNPGGPTATSPPKEPSNPGGPTATSPPKGPSIQGAPTVEIVTTTVPRGSSGRPDDRVDVRRP